MCIISTSGLVIEGLLAAAQEAAAAGVKVGEARRVLKLLQGLEGALAHTGEGQHALLKAKLDAALAGGVASPLLRQAHITLDCLQLTQVLLPALGYSATPLRHPFHTCLHRIQALGECCVLCRALYACRYARCTFGSALAVPWLLTIR